MPLTMVPYKDKGIFRFKSLNDVFQTLEDHQVQLSSMKSTRCITLAKPIIAFTSLTISN